MDNNVYIVHVKVVRFINDTLETCRLPYLYSEFVVLHCTLQRLTSFQMLPPTHYKFHFFVGMGMLRFVVRSVAAAVVFCASVLLCVSTDWDSPYFTIKCVMF